MVTRLSFAAVATVLIVCFSGCGSFLDRPRPSREAYTADYLEYFDASQIEKLDYAYRGAIGGAMTVGRAKFKDSVRLKDLLVESRVKSGVLTAETYDPADTAEGPGATEFRHQWEVHAGGTIPPWFDFPFDRKMRVLRETGGGTDAHPRYEKVWYVDEERGVVYIRGNWG